MRKRLGSLDKAPINKIEESATKNSLTAITCVIALVVTYFGVNFGVDFFNFMEENTEGDNFMKYNDEIVLYIKGAIGLLSVIIIINRR